MPEIKNTFLQGKMNKDLDERLIPNGQYRDAMNVEVSTSEGSDIGAVKNILGNQRIEDIVPPGFKCVGSIANEKTNKLYWFISSYAKDAIIEHDIINDKTDPVIVDLNAGNSKAVLKFSGNIITGINIINNLLFWTDNNSEPKKINIDECKKGTPDIDTHTQLVFENGSFNGLTVEIVAKNSPSTFGVAHWPPLTPIDEMVKSGLYFWYQRRPMIELLGLDFDSATTDDGYMKHGWYNSGNPYAYTSTWGNAAGPEDTYLHNIRYIRHYRNNKFLGIKQIRLFDQHNGTHGRLEWTNNGPLQGFGSAVTQSDFHVGDVLFGNNIKLDIEERHITVIKPKPLKAPTVKINHTQTLDSPSNIPNLFETTFPRFSYRYKFKDGEFSAFAPFTEPVFNPKYTKDINSTSDTNVFYTKDNVYDVKDPHNKAMVNSIHSVELTDFITAKTPEDAIEIEILYKQEISSVIYSINTIKQTDPEWHRWSNSEGANIGFGKQIRTDALANAANYNPTTIKHIYASDGSLTKGKYIVTTENIHAALPANQLLRPWDNVPRKALGQEITGNRIVYGNYLQNYNLGNIKPEIKVGYNDRNNQLGTFENKGLPSIKSQRNYQLGVVYCDKYGRETPVFTSSEGAVSIPWQKADGTKNASKSLQLNASVVSNFPEWVDSFKFFVKETSSPYYNLVMDKAWVAKSTYELDRGDHLWISFPSSDRNKISEEDYIILKKKIGTGEEQIAFENKFKVIDVKNEAPDAIKYEFVNYGSTGRSDFKDTMLTQPSMRIDVAGNDNLYFDIDQWKATHLMKGISLEDGDDVDMSKLRITDLYASWRRVSGGNVVSSKKYKILSGRLNGSHYMLKLQNKISVIDADLAHLNGDSSEASLPATLHGDLHFQIEKKQLKDSEDFSGKFFVKISKNQVTDLIEEGSTTDVLDNYIVSAKTPTWYWQDDVGSSIVIDNQSSYGLSNYNGENQAPSGNNTIQDASNNSVGNFHPIGTPTYTTNLKLTDYAAAWDGIKLNPDFGNTFFIDSMHMVAAQSEASNYAKYSCVTWAGCTKDQTESQETSSWSYPPLKMWLTDWRNSENVIENLDQEDEQARFHDAIESGLIDTSPVNVADGDFKLLNEDTAGVKVTGWVGPSQVVDRHTPTSFTNSTTNFHGSLNHVNGLEGIVTTVDDHSTGPRRWLSGITGNPTDHGVGVDTKTYSDDGEIGRHFMHLSFFAPGKELHDGSWQVTSSLNHSTSMMFGPGSFMANLQGIWGGGMFTGGNSKHQGLLSQDRFGDDLPTGIGYAGLPMEGNHDSTDGWLPETPGPGVGYGYDTSKNYQELHERQWDPTFCDDGDPNNKIRDFIRNLHAGSQFKFSSDTTDNIYTIKKVVVKKLYNHTSWRTPFNRYQTTDAYHSPLENILYQSVEEAGLKWLDTVPDITTDNGSDPLRESFKSKIVDFGKASNRRLCYIIELDKNPTDQSFNPLLVGTGTAMTADTTDDEFANIEFVEKVQSTLLAGLNKFPAIWETDPKRQKVNLDIYYEASNNFPIKLNERTNELIAPLGCKVEMLGIVQISGVSGSSSNISHLMSWNGTTAVLDPGFPVGNDIIEIEYSGIPFKFTKEDGSYVILTADEQQLLGQSTSSALFKTDFVFRHDIGDNIRVGLGWHNCFSFGNGLESNRIRDDFNEMYIGNGVKASTTTQQIYEEEHRAHGMIYSGLYNSNSGVNDLNQFIMAEKITKDLNPSFGSIQKLFQRRISLIAFCEDKVISITSNKDALYNADGNPQLVATNLVLGDANPFQGNFGISKNPESFASESYRAYFTDKQRGAVIRLSKDGLTPISKTGMQDWFRDNLQNYGSLIGSYDGYKEDYNVTLTHKFGENFIYNSFLGEGVELGTQVGSLLNYIINSGINDGIDFQYAYNKSSNISAGTLIGDFLWGPPDTSFGSEVILTNHAEIPYEGYQDEQLEQLLVVGQPLIIANTQLVPGAPLATYGTYATTTTTTTTTGAGAATTSGPTTYAGGGIIGQGGTQYTGFVGTSSITTTSTYAAGDPGSAFVPATYDDANGSLADDGWWYDPRFTSVTADLFGGSATNLADAQVYSTIKRVIGGISISESNDIGSNNGYPNWSSNMTYNASIEKPIKQSWGSGSYSNLLKISQAITRNDGTYDGTNDAITFDRPDPFPAAGAYSYVEFKNIGSNGTPSGAGINQTYVNNGGTQSGNIEHDSFFNGDELHIQFELTCYVTLDGISGSEAYYGYNYIIPKIELFDGNTLVSSNKLTATSTGLGGTDPYSDRQTAHSDMGGDFEDEHNLSSGYIYYQAALADLRCIPKYFRTSASVLFPDTETGSVTLSGTHSSHAGTKTVICGASFKFIDPTQQNADGTPIASGADITEVKVINDLRIRISNANPKATSGYDYPTTSGGSNKPLRHPLWEINKLFIKKGFGVVAPHEDEVTGTSGTTGVSFYTTTVLFTAGLQAQYLAAQIFIQGVPYLPYLAPIPPHTIPAWVEVDHQGMGNEWSTHAASGGTVILESVGNQAYGPDFPGHLETPATGNPIGYSYLVHDEYGTQSPLAGNPNLAYNSSTSTATFNNGTATPDVNPTPIPDQYLEIDGSGNTNTYNGYLECDITGSEWEDNKWYLVDIEYDSGFNADTGNDGGDGEIMVYGVSQWNSIANGNAINPEGIGYYSGSVNARNCGMIQTMRTEYGSERMVLRAIFKVDSTSWVNQNSINKKRFLIAFQGFQNASRLTKLIVKKMDVPASGGAATSWVHSSDVLTHSFSKKELYYKNGKLNWDIEAPGNSQKNWYQTFPSNSLVPTPAGYTLKFTIGDNPDTGDHTGNLRVFCNNDIGPNGFEGMYYTGITDPGEYEINFNFKEGSTEISDGVDWSIYRDGSSYGSASYFNSSTVTSWISANVGNRIWFGQMDGTSDAFRMSISDLSLIDNTLIFQGGTSGSWNWDGFFTSLESYISWDYDNGRIQFGELDPNDPTVVITPCPFVDPDSTATLKVPISANQWLNRTINRYETYNIEFTHGIHTGELDIYYFNSEGYGFRIKNINHLTSSPYTVQVMIGADDDGNMSEKRLASHPASQPYQPELKETFVITPSAFNDQGNDITGSNEVAGHIDDITMTRVYNIELDENDEPIFQEKTVTFSEDVNGWTSFKSFVPESGVSLSKKYFTFDEGKLFKHYVPLTYDKTEQEWIDSTVKDAENYNIFYGNHGTDSSTGDIFVSSDAASKIKFVLNNEPSAVKMFNTLNYEGTQTHIKKPGHVDYVTVNNAIAWTKDMDIQGWQCTEIKTDLDAGSVIEFIKKEGKWFNYIKGKSTQDLDTSRFSVQGIGISDTINL